MNKKRMQKHVTTLKHIKQLKPDQKLDFLKNCSDECIHTICEACYNILNQSLKFNKDKLYRVKKKLKPIRDDVRKLSNPKLSVKTKREILRKPQVGKGIFTLLATTVLPALISSLISK
jgi:hypothetical protein